MRVLVDPFVSLTNVRADSGYNGMVDTLEVWKEMNPELQAHVIVPNGSEVPKKHDWIHHVGNRVQPGRAQMMTVPSSFGERFGMAVGSEPVDLVFTQKTFAIPAYKNAMTDPRYQGMSVPVCLYDLMAGGKKDAADCETVDMEIQKVLGYGAADYVTFLTPAERRACLRLMNRYFTGSFVRAKHEGWYDRWGGIYEGSLKDMPKTRTFDPKSEEFVVMFGGRMNNTKRWQLCTEYMELLHASGRKVRGVVSTPSNSRGKEELEREFPSVEFHIGAGRGLYYHLLSKAHIFLYASKSEGFPAGVAEAMYSGCIAVLPRKGWVEGLLGDMEYPFLWSSRKEAYAHLAWIYDHYDDPMLEDLRAQVRERIKWMGEQGLNGIDRTRKVVSDMEELAEKARHLAVRRMSRGHAEIIDEAFDELPEEFTLTQLWQGYLSKKEIRAEWYPFNRSHPTKWMVRQYIRSRCSESGARATFRKLEGSDGSV